MADVFEIRIPHENVNDDSVMLMAWRVADGDSVEKDQPLVEVETSKATYEIPSPARGLVRFVVSGECEVPVGTVLGYVGESLPAIEAFVELHRSAWHRRVDSAHTTVLLDQVKRDPVTEQTIALPISPQAAMATTALREDVASCPPSATRFSRKARELIQRQGLSEADFPNRGLFRTCDLLPSPPVPSPPSLETSLLSPANACSVVRGAAGVPVRSEPVSRSKRLEARLLSWSTQQALRSSVVTTVSGSQSEMDSEEDQAELRSVRLISAVAQLLKKYPAMNGYCDGQQNHLYEQINIGYAIDAGNGLKVPVFRQADTKSLDDLLVERQRFIHEYLTNTLRPESLAGGTFTISDLSGSGVVLFDPLISEAQAGILGVGANEIPRGEQTAFNLILSFDHRLVEGRAAARFVNELKERLLANEKPAPWPVMPRCAICQTSAQEIALRKHFLVSTVGESSGRTKLVCTICLSGR